MDTLSVYSLLELMDISFSKFNISDRFKGYICDFKMYEFKKGMLVDSSSAIEKLPVSVRNILEIQNDLPIGIYSHKKTDSLLKVYCRIGGLGLNLKFNLLPDIRYSWKEVYDMQAGTKKIQPFQFFPLIAYTAPVGEKYSSNPGSSEFCKINGESIAYPNWFKELGIEHYYVVGIHLKK